MAMKYRSPEWATEHSRGCQSPAQTAPANSSPDGPDGAIEHSRGCQPPAQTAPANCSPEWATEHRRGCQPPAQMVHTQVALKGRQNIKWAIMILFLCLLSCPLSAVAQQTADVTKSINTIKSDKQYLYAEATMKTQDEALEGAKAILETIVSDWINEQYPDKDIELCIVKAKDHCQQLQTQRGNFYRAFVYVRKNDILPVDDQKEVAAFQVESQNGKTDATTPQAITLSEEEQRMKEIYQFAGIEPYVKELKATGKVSNYGKYATMPASGCCHLFVYNPQGEVVAVLRKDNATTVNLRTMQKDEITNYKNCGAIWLQLKTAQE